MSTEIGVVQNVLVRRIGDVLAADVAIGASTLTLVDAAEFNEDGGTLTIDDETIDYLSVDDESGVVQLAVTLAAAHTADVEVFVEPAAYVKTAVVSIDAAEEPIEANVSYAMWDRLPEGVRVDNAEQVELWSNDIDDFEIRDVLGTEPVIEASYIDTSTMPPIPATSLTDIPPPAIDDLESGTYNGTMTIAGAITTRAVDPVTNVPTGPGQDLSPSGLFSYGPVDDNGDEQRRFEAPTDPLLPHVFRGDAFIERLTTLLFTALQASSLAEGAILTLLSGVQPPSNAPTVSYEWNQLQLAADDASLYRGVGFDGTNVVTGYAVLQSGSYKVFFDRYNASTGAFVDTIASEGLLDADLYDFDLQSCCADSTNAYALIKATRLSNSNVTWFVIKQPLSGAATQRSDWNDADGTRGPAIGLDGSSVVVAQNRSSTDLVRIRRYTFNDGGSLASTSTLNSDYSVHTDLANIWYNSSDFGAGFQRFVISTRGSAVAVIAQENNQRQLAESWPYPDNIGARVGMYWNGAAWVDVSQDGMQTTYESNANLHWFDPTLDSWFAAIAWRKSTGVYETPRSSMAVFGMKKRARLRITGFVAPSTGTYVPDQCRFLLYRGTPAPAAGAMYSQALVTLAAGVAPQLLITAPDFATATHDATTNTFPNGAASRISAANSSAYFDANGDGDVGTSGFRDSAAAAAARCFVSRVAALAAADSTNTLLAFDTEDFDPHAMHAAGVITVPKAGVWRVTFNGAFDANASGRRQLRMNKNSATATTNTVAFHSVPAASGAETALDVVFVVRLAAGDQLRLWANQNSGGSLQLVTGVTIPPQVLVEYVHA